MREIKFRVFDKLAKYMHVCGEDVHDEITFEIGTNRAYYFNMQNGCGSLREDSDYVLMQYTGLKDKNGKEIYEGDIVKIVDTEYQTRHIAIIEFLEASFILRMIKGEYAGEALMADSWLDEEKEVIGNIYETPELLEGGE